MGSLINPWSPYKPEGGLEKGAQEKPSLDEALDFLTDWWGGDWTVERISEGTVLMTMDEQGDITFYTAEEAIEEAYELMQEEAEGGE